MLSSILNIKLFDLFHQHWLVRNWQCTQIRERLIKKVINSCRGGSI